MITLAIIMAIIALIGWRIYKLPIICQPYRVKYAVTRDYDRHSGSHTAADVYLLKRFKTGHYGCDRVNITSINLDSDNWEEKLIETRVKIEDQLKTLRLLTR